MIRIPYTLKEGTYDKELENALKVVEKNKIKLLGEFPKRQLPKEPKHKDKINNPKLSLMGALNEVISKY